MNIRIIGAVVAMLGATQALAGLGAAPAATSAPAAAGAARAVPRPVVAARYTVNEIQTAGGGVVKEYVSTQGIVFAISWRTPLMPDLHELLGEYFPSFERAAVDSRSTGRRGPLNIDTPDLVLQSAGHMRDYRGRAYVPGLLPPDVSGAEIQ